MVNEKPRNRVLSSITLMLIFFLAPTLSSCGLRDISQLPSATPASTIMPKDITPALPDLIIREISFSINPNSSDPCFTEADSLGSSVLVENQGYADASSFTVELNHLRQEVSNGLNAGSRTTLWFPVSELQATGNVDATYLVAESNENNNQLFRQLTLPTLPPECNQTPTPPISFQDPIHVMVGHTAKVCSVAFSPDGSLVASGSVDNTLRLWQVEQGKLLRTMYGHPFPVLLAKFSPDGASLATGSTDSVVRLWWVSDARLQRSLVGHAGWITGLDFSEDEKFLVSSAEDFTVRVWRMADARQVQTIDEGMAIVNDVVFSPDSQMIAWAESNGDVRIRTLSGAWLHHFRSTEVSATTVAFSPDGTWLASGFSDGTLRIWRVLDGEALQTIRGHVQEITGVSFSPDGEWLVTSSLDSTLRLWRFTNEGVQTIPVLVYSGHTGPVNSVDFSPEGSLIVSGSDDNTIRLWQVPEQ